MLFCFFVFAISLSSSGMDGTNGGQRITGLQAQIPKGVQKPQISRACWKNEEHCKVPFNHYVISEVVELPAEKPRG